MTNNYFPMFFQKVIRVIKNLGKGIVEDCCCFIKAYIVRDLVLLCLRPIQIVHSLRITLNFCCRSNQ